MKAVPPKTPDFIRPSFPGGIKVAQTMEGAPVNSRTTRTVLSAAVVWMALGASSAAAEDSPPRFSEPTAINNDYLPLSSFHRCTLRGEEDGERLRVKRTVLDRTRTFLVDGVPVETMVVKDRVHADGKLIEDTRDFFAQDDDGGVHYFGERVDNVRDGRIVNHHGTWLYGRDTQQLGVLMPADPHVGSHWMSEAAPPDAIEYDRVVARLRRAEAGGRAYRNVIRVREFSQPDREVEFKLYARGVGVVAELPPDGEVELAGCTPA